MDDCKCPTCGRSPRYRLCYETWSYVQDPNGDRVLWVDVENRAKELAKKRVDLVLAGWDADRRWWALERSREGR